MRKLPPPERLRMMYVQQGYSLAELAVMHGLTSREAVYNTMRRDARRLGLSWPVKADRTNAAAHARHLDTVWASGVQEEILARPETRTRIAEMAGVPRQTVQEIVSGRRKRVRRETAERIMRAIEKLEAA